jgi:hypothetical protein
MILFMYSECTNTEDPPIIISIFLCFGCILCLCLRMDMYFLCSILSINIFIILFTLIVELLKKYSAYIIGILFLVCY